MKKIVVPIDFTPASKNATEYAMSLARATAAEVQLLHVYAEPMPVGNVPEPAMIAVDMLEINSKRLQQETDRLKDQYNLAVSGSLATGFRGNAINDSVKNAGADLVVMGLKKAHAQRLLGSTTRKMIRKSGRPVLVVPEEARFRPIKNIVVAVDFTEMVSGAGFAVLFALAKHFDSSVTVIHVEGKGQEMKATESAEKLQLSLVLSPMTYTYDRVESNDVDRAILDFVANHATDLLVMVAHPHSLFERLFNTVHTTAISASISIPLLVLKAQQQDQ